MSINPIDITGQEDSILPQLVVETVPIEQFHGIAVADAKSPLYWAHDQFELVGIGETLVLEFRGPSRFEDAKNVWQALVSRARITDPIKTSGTGLVAFTSFAFDDYSAEASYLILPQTIIGRNVQQVWRTDLTWHSSSATSPEGATGIAALEPVTQRLSGRIIPAQNLQGVRFIPSSFSAESFTEAVAQSTALIEQGALEKVVLARDLVLESSSDPDYRLTLLRLALRYPNCWTFAVHGLIGSSPETLLELHKGQFEVRVLAGSASRGDTSENDANHREALLNSAKNRQEHHYAVDSALAALSEVVETVETGDTFALQLPNLWHLATDIHGELDEQTSPFEVLDALHPTAAVAGTPTPAALELIRELENFDRGRYAGPVGWLSADGDGQWAIALRSALTDADGKITAYAGCGIVADSDSEEELAETRLKFRPILEALGVEEH